MTGGTQQGSSLNAAISAAVGRIVADYVGRGPRSVRTTIREDVVCVVMRDTFTKAEHKLLEAGQGAFVKDMRLRFQATMRADLVGAVTELTGREVEAFFSDHNLDPDVGIEVFTLVPDDSPARDESSG